MAVAPDEFTDHFIARLHLMQFVAECGMVAVNFTVMISHARQSEAKCAHSNRSNEFFIVLRAFVLWSNDHFEVKAAGCE